MTEFVLDCSVTMGWCFIDEASTYGDRVLDFLQTNGAGAVVPQLWSLEVANVLLVGERRGRLTMVQTTRAVTLLQSLPIVVDDLTARQGMELILALGRECSLSSYDAAYLELAMREGLPLATTDNRLSNAARSCGVAILFEGFGV